MSRWTIVSALVAVTVFPIVAIGALRVVTQPWIVHFEVDRGHLPADRYGFTDADRVRLGLVGLEAIRPGGEGIALLRRTTLADGRPAFGVRELRHMEDVRGIVGFLFHLHTALLAGVVLAALVLTRSVEGRAAVPRGLRWGSFATVAIAGTLGITMLVAWDAFFETFHRIVFDGRSWWFPAEDTLRRVYPDAFWLGVAAWITGLATAFTGFVLGLSRWWLGRVDGSSSTGRAGGGASGDEMSRAA